MKNKENRIKTWLGEKKKDVDSRKMKILVRKEGGLSVSIEIKRGWIP